MIWRETNFESREDRSRSEKKTLVFILFPLITIVFQLWHCTLLSDGVHNISMRSTYIYYILYNIYNIYILYIFIKYSSCWLPTSNTTDPNIKINISPSDHQESINERMFFCKTVRCGWEDFRVSKQASKQASK